MNHNAHPHLIVAFTPSLFSLLFFHFLVVAGHTLADPAYQAFLATLAEPPTGPTMDDVLAQLEAQAKAGENHGNKRRNGSRWTATEGERIEAQEI